jgi:hypothetical protein
MAYPRGAERAAEKRGSVTTKEFKQALKDASALVGEEIALAAVPPLRIAKMVKRFQDLTESSARLRMARKIQQATKKATAGAARKGKYPNKYSAKVNPLGIKESDLGKKLIKDANKRVATELRRAATARAAKRVGLSPKDRLEVINRKLASIGRVAQMERKEGRKLGKALADEAKALRVEHRSISEGLNK